MDEVLAAKDCKCSPSFSLHTQQRRSWPPVATMDEPSAMQLIDEGEATHSCWRAAIFLVWGSYVGCLDGRRHDTDRPLQRNKPEEHVARWRRTKRMRFLVCLRALAPRAGRAS